MSSFYEAFLQRIICNVTNYYPITDIWNKEEK